MNELDNLKSLVGGHAFRALLNGRPLKIWRRSSPHNWFIESAKGGDFLWHSGDYNRHLPSLALFDKLKDSNEKILQYWGSDSGMPELSLYVLKRKLTQRALDGAGLCECEDADNIPQRGDGVCLRCERSRK